MAALALAVGGCATTEPASGGTTQVPRNIVIMFADGAGPTQWSFGQYSSRVLRKQPFAVTDIVFREGTLGLLSTSPYGTYVTDSDGRPLTTLMQAAKAAGKRIGLATTATVYDATPAAFALNTKSRRDYAALAEHFLALEPDVLLGGGAEFFLPQGVAGGKRKDGKDLIAAFRAKGYVIARNTAQLKSATGAKLLGLFADQDMDFEIDRVAEAEPTTAEMTAAALRALAQAAPKGFVLLIENENVDTAAHANDAASLMRALWAFDDAVKVALEFQRRNPETLVIVTGDHETGGFSPTYALKDFTSLSSGNRLYAGDEHLRMLEGITMSFAAVRDKLGPKPSGETLDKLIATAFPGFTLDADLRALILARKTGERNFANIPENSLGMMVARQTGFYWGTSGHTPEPVAVGAIGPGARLFAGFQDNTDFGKHLHRLLAQ